MDLRLFYFDVAKYEFVFCMCLDMYKSYKFVQSFQVDLVRHVLLCTSNSKWYVNHITRMGLKYVDCLHIVKHLQMDLFGLVHAYGFSQLSLSMLKVILNIESAICQD